MAEDFWILSFEGICRPTYISYHRFPKNRAKLGLWLQAFQLSAEQLRSHSRVCSRHFRGDVKNVPDPTLLGRFASPIKKDAPKLNEDKVSGSMTLMFSVKIRPIIHHWKMFIHVFSFFYPVHTCSRFTHHFTQ